MQHKDNIQTASSLREQAKSLWVKLDVDEAERASFLARHVGFKKSVIAAVGILFCFDLLNITIFFCK